MTNLCCITPSHAEREEQPTQELEHLTANPCFLLCWNDTVILSFFLLQLHAHKMCVCVQLQKSEMLVTTLMGKQTYKNTKLILKKIVYPSNVKVKWLKEIKVSGWRGDGWGWDSRGCVEDFSVIYVNNYHPIYLWRTKQDFTSKY